MYQDHAKAAVDIVGSARKLQVITPDIACLRAIPRALYVGGAGDLQLFAADDDHAVILKNVPAGTVVPIRVRCIGPATTATVIVGLF